MLVYRFRQLQDFIGTHAVGHGREQRLQLLGIPAERIEAVSFGREKPVAYGHSEEAWAQNRRADIVYPTEVTSGKAAQ